MSAFDDSKPVQVFCDICHGRMTQSRNNPLLYLCYLCNDKKNLQEAPITLNVVPKVRSPNKQYKEPFYFAAENFTIAAEQDEILGQFQLMGKEYARNYLKEKHPEQYEIEEKFKKLLDTNNIKVEFKRHNKD